MPTLAQVLPPLAAFLLTWAGLAVMLQTGIAHRLAMDQPNERSLHVTAIPRTGGLVLIPAALAAWLAGGMALVVPAALAALLSLLSYADDRHGLPIAIRFGVHLAAAAVVATALLPGAGGAVLLLAVLGIGWTTNLYNFMDGADGLAGGMALFGFGACGVAAQLAGAGDLAAACFALAAAAAGFLMLNFNPAKVFLGDSGSIPLGFLAGSLGGIGIAREVWPWWFPLLVFSPFVVDATATLIRRALRGDKVWQAHREHYYQRLVRCGWSHRRLALGEYLLMAACAAVGVAAVGAGAAVQAAVLGTMAAVYLCVMLLIDRRWRRHQRDCAPPKP